MKRQGYRTGSEWTEADDALLTQLKDQGLTYLQISASFSGRTPRAVEARWRRIEEHARGADADHGRRLEVRRLEKINARFVAALTKVRGRMAA